MEVFWRLPAINADPRQWNGPPNTKPKPRNCTPCPCLHAIAKPAAITRAPLCGIKVPRFFQNLSSYLTHCKALRFGLTAQNCVQGLCGESEKYSRARGPFCRPPIDHFAGPRRGASEADQGPQKPTRIFRKKKAVILTTIPLFPKNLTTSLTARCFPLLPFPLLHLSRRCYHSPHGPTLSRRSHYDKAQSAPAWRN